MGYEYKCVGAPERAKRQKGARTRSDRVAHAMQDLIGEHAVDGWEYLRTDLVPVEEKSSFMGRSHEVHRAVLIFRRDVLRLGDFDSPEASQEQAEAPLAANRDAPDPQTSPPLRPRRAPSGLS